MLKSRVLVLAASAMIVAAACSTGGGSSAAPSGGSAAGCKIGMSWNNYQEERWAKWDEPAIKAAIEAGGGEYISNDAKSSAEAQATNVENLISQGAKVVIILAEDGTSRSSRPSPRRSATGIPVIAYDRLIEDPGVLYHTFDNVEVGRMMAREIFAVVPKGAYAIIKGNEADANARLPARRHGRDHRRGRQGWRHQDRRRRVTPTAGSRTTPRPTWRTS